MEESWQPDNNKHQQDGSEEFEKQSKRSLQKAQLDPTELVAALKEAGWDAACLKTALSMMAQEEAASTAASSAAVRFLI